MISNSPKYQTINFEVTDNTGILRINTPPKNTLGKLFFEELDDWLKQNTVTIGKLRGLVVSGSGRHFSEGSDVKFLVEAVGSEQKTKASGMPEFVTANIAVLKRLSAIPVPLIAAINGVCLGSGFELALYCHFRLAHQKALLSLPESNFGLMPGLGGLQKAFAVGRPMDVFELALSGKMISASEAFDMGLVDFISPEKDCVLFALKIIEYLHQTKGGYRRYLRRIYLNDFKKFLNGTPAES